MPWIRDDSEPPASPETRRVLELLRAADGEAPSPLDRVTARHAEALEGRHRLGRELFFGPSPLSRAQRLMIALAVSATNTAKYHVARHRRALASETGNPGLAEQLARDYQQADLTAADRALLDFAVSLTCEPEERTAQDVERLRDYGLDDEVVLHVAEIAAFVNMENRLALGLGLEAEES